MRNIFKDSQIRLFVTGTIFALVFVWMAVYSYDVEKEVIQVFLILSFMMVGALIVSGFLFSFVIKMFRSSDRGLPAAFDKEPSAAVNKEPSAAVNKNQSSGGEGKEP